MKEAGVVLDWSTPERDLVGQVAAGTLALDAAGTGAVGAPGRFRGAMREHELDALFALLTPPEWHRRAACRGMGPEDFYGAGGGAYRRAVAVCGRCPVAVECLADADEHGIRGGLTADQRRRRSADPAA